MKNQLAGSVDDLIDRYKVGGKPSQSWAAELFVQEYGPFLRYTWTNGWATVDRDGRSFVWEMSPAATIPSHAVMRYMSTFLLDLEQKGTMIYENAPTMDGKKAGAEISRKATQLRAANQMVQVLKLAQSHPAVTAHPDDFDADPHLVAFENGIVDLRTGELLDLTFIETVDKMVSKQIPFPFNPEKECHEWEAALLDICSDDPESVEFLQRWFGYCLSGDVSAQRMLVLYGGGANGKSMVIEIIESIVGSYGMSATIGIFRAPEGGAADASGARLRGKRLAVIDESDVSFRGMSMARLKGMVAGGRLSARNLYAQETDESEFSVQAHFTITTNHLPDLASGDESVWRRVWALQFSEFYTSDPGEGQKLRDDSLPQVLAAESEGIAAWLVRGAVAAINEGIEAPARVRDFTAEYRAAVNPLNGFYNAGTGEGWLVESPGSDVQGSEVKRAYDLHHELTGGSMRHAWEPKQLYGAIRDAGANYGVGTKKKKDGLWFTGLVLAVDLDEKERELNDSHFPQMDGFPKKPGSDDQ